MADTPRRTPPRRSASRSDGPPARGSQAKGSQERRPQERGPQAKGQDAPGLPARRLACEAFEAVTEERRALDETLDRLLDTPAARALDDRDAGLVRAIATTTVRRFGTIRRVLLDRLPSGLPEQAGPLPEVLATAVAQLLFMDVPDHAAVDLAIRLLAEDRHGQRYTKLANGVLRRIGREKEAILAALDPLAMDTPAWLRRRWTAAYGEETAARIATAHMSEAAVDLTVREDAAGWAATLEARVLPTGSVRLPARTPLAALPGYAEGAWWVQDMAAALPARLLGVAPGERVADLCAAPGGKTAQLAAAGASVVAVDRSAPRLQRLAANMKRLGLTVETLVQDATEMEGAGQFDAVLLDAPCSATGTMRRHPDVAWTKEDQDVFRLAALQTRLLARAVDLLRPGGRLVYCTCSLEPEEGEAQVRALLARDPRVERRPVAPEEVGGLAEAVNADGELRTLPFFLPDPDGRMAGMDGFFAARLVRIR